MAAFKLSYLVPIVRAMPELDAKHPGLQIHSDVIINNLDYFMVICIFEFQKFGMGHIRIQGTILSRIIGIFYVYYLPTTCLLLPNFLISKCFDGHQNFWGLFYKIINFWVWDFPCKLEYEPDLKPNDLLKNGQKKNTIRLSN